MVPRYVARTGIRIGFVVEISVFRSTTTVITWKVKTRFHYCKVEKQQSYHIHFEKRRFQIFLSSWYKYGFDVPYLTETYH